MAMYGDGSVGEDTLEQMLNKDILIYRRLTAESKKKDYSMEKIRKISEELEGNGRKCYEKFGYAPCLGFNPAFHPNLPAPDSRF